MAVTALGVFAKVIAALSLQLTFHAVLARGCCVLYEAGLAVLWQEAAAWGLSPAGQVSRGLGFN